MGIPQTTQASPTRHGGAADTRPAPSTRVCTALEILQKSNSSQ